jgi:hypothetical protein
LVFAGRPLNHFDELFGHSTPRRPTNAALPTREHLAQHGLRATVRISVIGVTGAGYSFVIDLWGLSPCDCSTRSFYEQRQATESIRYFAAFLRISAKRDRQPSAKMCPVGKHFCWQWGRVERWNFFNTYAGDRA